MICPLDDLSAKKVIKFDALDEESVNLKTPMILSQNSIIFGNECYLYWLNLEKKSSEWKYVQRKEIYCLESIDDLGLVMVGGKNFSKLAYLGKSTSRTNIKVYTNG